MIKKSSIVQYSTAQYMCGVGSLTPGAKWLKKVSSITINKYIYANLMYQAACKSCNRQKDLGNASTRFSTSHFRRIISTRIQIGPSPSFALSPHIHTRKNNYCKQSGKPERNKKIGKQVVWCPASAEENFRYSSSRKMGDEREMPSSLSPTNISNLDLRHNHCPGNHASFVSAM
jgi:hypothetical protein